MRQKKRPDQTKFTKGQKYINRLKSMRTFEPFYRKSERNNPIFRPKTAGEKIVGIVGKPFANFRDSTSYPIQLDDGRIIELPGNKVLHHLVKITDCIFQRVEITYEGREYLSGGHYRKIYSLKPAPL